MTIQLNSIAKSYNIHRVLEDVTLKIVPKSRIGLVGRNGGGKSTLLKIIMGQVEPDRGSVSKTPGDRVNYLSQEPKITPGRTVYEELQSVFSEFNKITEEEQALFKKLEDTSLSDDAQMAIVNRLGEIHEAMEHMDTGNIDAKIGRILKGLGFSQEDHQRKTEEFSGGWKMRINLAKILLEGADYLLLDEPTNHLDLDACEWLEDFLVDYPGGLVIVSHDRHFIDKVTTETAELELGKLRVWNGNYSSFLQQKEEELTNITSAHDRQQKELAKQTAFVDRFRASATRSTQAKSREKLLEKIERIEVPQGDNRKVAFRFPPPQASGKEVLILKKLKKSFDDKHLFSDLNAILDRERRVFLLGANGCGKTTLFRMIMGVETADEGSVKFGHNTLLAYFSQNQLDTLDPNITLFDTLQNIRPDLDNTEIRTILGRFLFTKEQVFKNVSMLSGGEKSKVALAKMMISGPNTLLLDEPTNHIDIQTKDVMTQALKDYEGSIVCISHDRYFIEELATDIWEIYNGHLLTYCGGYEYYLAKREETRDRIDRKKPEPEPEPKVASAHQQSFRERKELEKQFKKIEKTILTLETDIKKLEKDLHNPEYQEDYQKLQGISASISKKNAELEKLNAEWLTVSESLGVS